MNLHKVDLIKHETIQIKQKWFENLAWVYRHGYLATMDANFFNNLEEKITIEDTLSENPDLAINLSQLVPKDYNIQLYIFVLSSISQ